MPVETLPQTLPGERPATTPHDEDLTQHSPLYNVILLDDDFHSYEYVIEMLQVLLGCPESWAFQMAREVDTTGKVILDRTTLEEAETLRKKVQGYGADPRIPACKGSMTAVVEPAD